MTDWKEFFKGPGSSGLVSEFWERAYHAFFARWEAEGKDRGCPVPQCGPGCEYFDSEMERCTVVYYKAYIPSKKPGGICGPAGYHDCGCGFSKNCPWFNGGICFHPPLKPPEVEEKLTETFGPLPICKYFRVEGVCNFPPKPPEPECKHKDSWGDIYNSLKERCYKGYKGRLYTHCPLCGKKLK